MRLVSTLVAVFLLACAASALHGQMITVNRDGETISGPPPTMDHVSWIRAINEWRDSEKRRVKYNGALYDVPATKWTQRSFMEPQVMSQERYLYDPVTRRYTVDRYLDDLRSRYGGIDSVLIWTGYPNMGIDNRNQFDWMRDLPGGLAGIRSMIADFHRRGVQVLFPVNPWDKGTRLEALPIEQTVAQTFRDAGIDGIFGDTMGGGYNRYIPAAQALNYPMPLEPELGVDPQYNILNWAGWIGPPMPPPRPRKVGRAPPPLPHR
jgi:iron(II)-dependent oxidoreductase